MTFESISNGFTSEEEKVGAQFKRLIDWSFILSILLGGLAGFLLGGALIDPSHWQADLAMTLPVLYWAYRSYRRACILAAPSFVNIQTKLGLTVAGSALLTSIGAILFIGGARTLGLLLISESMFSVQQGIAFGCGMLLALVFVVLGWFLPQLRIPDLLKGEQCA